MVWGSTFLTNERGLFFLITSSGTAPPLRPAAVAGECATPTPFSHTHTHTHTPLHIQPQRGQSIWNSCLFQGTWAGLLEIPRLNGEISPLLTESLYSERRVKGMKSLSSLMSVWWSHLAISPGLQVVWNCLKKRLQGLFRLPNSHFLQVIFVILLI